MKTNSFSVIWLVMTLKTNNKNNDDNDHENTKK